MLVSALDPNYALDLYFSKASNGSNIEIYEMNGSNAQTWLFKEM